MAAKEQQRIKDLEVGKALGGDREASVTRGTGKGGGAVRKIIAKTIPYTVDWKSVMMRYLRVAENATKVWTKPGIKGLAAGYPQQGKIPNPNKLDAIFAIDTSGSIGTAELEYACAVAKQMAMTARNLKCRIVLWHGEAYYISDPINSQGALEETIKNITTESGGTVMSSVADLLAARNINPYVTIYITDGYVEEDVRLPRSKNLVVIVNRASSDEEFRTTMAKKFESVNAEVICTPDLSGE